MEETGNEHVVAFSTDKSKKKNDQVLRARQKFPQQSSDSQKKTSSICKKAGMIFFYLTVHMLNIQ